MYMTEKLKGENSREYALRIIKEKIIRLELEPGSLVSEKDLAGELGLSRTPVREALLELSKVKIVEILPQRGNVISLVDSSLVDESRLMRNTLECAVVKEVCRMISPGDILQIQANLQSQEFYLEKQKPEFLMELDNQFHFMLFKIAQKIQIYHMMSSFAIHFDRIRNMTLYAVKDLKIVEDHRAILDAIMKGDEQAASGIMETHLGRYVIDEQTIRQKYSHYFKPL